MTLGTADLDDALETARVVAVEAGDWLLARLFESRRVERKGDVNLVTDEDRGAEEMIVSRLLDRFPGWGVMAEEGGATGRDESAIRWIVDPLDGTTNYSRGHPVFAVSIGLEAAGDLVAGVVHMPAFGWTVAGRRGGGVRMNGREVRVSRTTSIGSAFLATGFPYDRRTAADDNTREYAAFVKRALGVRRCGAAAVDLALTAAGIYDGFWEPRLAPWDLAAGVTLVREAGGLATDYEGAPVDIRRGWIVAANPAIHAALLEIIREARLGLDQPPSAGL